MANLANLFVNVRTLAFGLDKTPRFERNPKEMEDARKKAFDDLDLFINELKVLAEKSPALTKATKELLECENYMDLPRAQLYLQYCPDNMRESLSACAKLAQTENKEQLSKETFHNKLVPKIPAMKF